MRGSEPRVCQALGCQHLSQGMHWDNGKENGNYYNVALYWGYIRDYIGIIDNGKENGSYYLGFRDYRDYIGLI